MTLKKIIKKNKMILALAAVAMLTIVILAAVLLSGPQQDVPSQLADENANAGISAAEIESGELAQASPEDQAQIFGPPDACDTNGGECVDNSIIDSGNYPQCQQINATCPGGTAQTCCKVATAQDPPQGPEQGPTTCELNGGQCIGTGDISSCGDVGVNWAQSTGACLNNAICCQELEPTSCSSLGGTCESESACGQRNYQTSDCTSVGQVCCIPDNLGTSPAQPIDPPEGGQDNPDGGSGDESPGGSDDENRGGGSKRGFPPGDPSNYCSTQVTCGECNEECSSGSGTCQTCSTADNSCSYKLACSDDPNDPIFSNTCGKGEFTDDTHTKRAEGDPNYNHVACTGGSVCEGGPNTDGLYYCIDPVEDGDNQVPPEGVTCDKGTDYNPTNACDTGCGKFNKCSDGEIRRESCVDMSYCEVDTPSDEEGSDENTGNEDEDPTDPDNFPKVTFLNTSPKGTAIIGDDNTITVEVRGEADVFSVYVHGTSEPVPGDEVIHGYNKNNLESNKFYFLKDVKNNQKFTFDTPANEGTYYIAVNAEKYGPNPGDPEGEIVCSWHEDAFQRDANGGIDLSDRLGVCPNIVREIAVTTQGNASADNNGNSNNGDSNASQPEGNTSSRTQGLRVTAQPSDNCGGHVEITWTDDTSDNLSSKGYWIYRGTSEGFTPNGKNAMDDVVAAGGIPTPRTGNPPYYDWASTPGKRYFYKVIAVDQDGSLRTSNAAWSDTSNACGN